MDRPPQVEASWKVLRPDVNGIGVCTVYDISSDADDIRSVG